MLIPCGKHLHDHIISLFKEGESIKLDQHQFILVPVQ